MPVNWFSTIQWHFRRQNKGCQPFSGLNIEFVFTNKVRIASTGKHQSSLFWKICSFWRPRKITLLLRRYVLDWFIEFGIVCSDTSVLKWSRIKSNEFRIDFCWIFRIFFYLSNQSNCKFLNRIERISNEFRTNLLSENMTQPYSWSLIEWIESIFIKFFKYVWPFWTRIWISFGAWKKLQVCEGFLGLTHH